MRKCLHCGGKLSTRESLCPECDLVPGIEHELVDLETTDDYEAEDLVGHVDEVTEAISERWNEFLVGDARGESSSQECAVDDLPVLMPIARSNARGEGLSVKLTPHFDVHSAPADSLPVVHLLFDVEPSGPALVAPADGAVAHVILALDLSGSMNHADKYPVLRRALERMLDDLQASLDGDVLLSIVVFAYGSETLLRDRPASTLDVREVLKLIDESSLLFSRYTDLSGALSRAGRIAFDSHKANPRLPIRIYALTDGRPQDMQRAKEAIQRIERLPVDVHGLAFGADADVQALQEVIGGVGGGTVQSVRSEMLADAFGHIAALARRVVAKRALLDVQLAPGVVGGRAYRYRPGRFAFGRTAFENGRLFARDLGTLEAGRKYSLFFELRLPSTAEDATELGRITLRVPGEGGARTFESLLSIPRHKGVYTPTPHPTVMEARAVLDAMDSDDSQTLLRSLTARRRIYVEERRDPYLVALLDRAIHELEATGSLDALSKSERAALLSHTQSVATEETDKSPQVADTASAR